MAKRVRWAAAALLALPLAINGCASRRVQTPVAVAPVAPARPLPPAGVFGTVALPPLGADGEFVTINRGIDAESTIWHVRAALNVAALGCRGAGSESLASGYNALLRAQRTVFARADAAVRSRYRAEQGSGWQSAHDAYMTRLYNYFAQPIGQAGFCAAAITVMAEAAAAQPSRFPAFALTALPRLDAPFTDGYRAYAEYRRDLAAWELAYGPNASPAARLAAATPRLRYAPVVTLLDWRAEGPVRSADRESRARRASAI